MSDELLERAKAQGWYHTLELPGLTTKGLFDLRGDVPHYGIPEDLSGKRVLEIGTWDGFWAFELERRGAGEVIAIDVLDAARLDRFVPDRLRGAGGRRSSERNFALASELLGSRVELRDLSVYDLRPADVGQFDLIVMGYVLQMLRDPLRGLEALRGVCRGRLILLETVSLPLELVPAPLARLDARRDGDEWFVFNRRGLRKSLELSGWVVEETTPILRDRTGWPRGLRELPLAPRARHVLGIRGRSAAVRARPLTL
jgi:tRNA (mo5U34)-methyltransferase